MTLRLAVTPGEPAGIGPDLLISLVQHGCHHELVAIADPAVLAERAKQLGLPLKLIAPRKKPEPLAPSELCIDPITCPVAVQAGQLNPRNGGYVVDCLDRAIALVADKQCAALITGPVQKSTINDFGLPFSGHTEYLAEKTATDQVVMMLASDSLRVALATTHLPLRHVADSIDSTLLESVIRILAADLESKFGIESPTILVAGLNPHAGESGHLGREEIEIIEPAIRRLQAEGYNLIGPLPADTLFTPKWLVRADAVLAMYHDQGLPVLKYQGFGRAANITLGLPIIRTSVDHGTALDLAATGSADTGSLTTAIEVAAQMASSQERT